MKIQSYLALTCLFSSTLAAAATPEQCVMAYSNQARRMEQKANRLTVGSRTLKYGGTTMGSSYGSTSGSKNDSGDVTSSTRKGVSTSAVIGGSSLGSTADGYTEDAQFAANVSQSIAESSAGVAGPFTTQLATDLNSAVYGWGSSPLGRSVRQKINGALNGRRVTAPEVAAATAGLTRSGGLCDASGQPLAQDAWATAIVTQITAVPLN